MDITSGSGLESVSELGIDSKIESLVENRPSAIATQICLFANTVRVSMIKSTIL